MVILLSPACASFDQFADFEARGDAFRALVSGQA
jgi:UDP-N-acetylmuramoylalanine--D-glutamate ligase